MKRASIAFIVMAAIAAGFLGSVIKDHVFEPVPAQAQARPLKVALLDLERVARSSAKFKQLKDQWELRQNALKEENRKLTVEFEDKKAELRRAMGRTDSSEDVAVLRVELTALEENIKTTKEVQKRYLADLLEHYQKQVIEHVMSEADGYCTREGYHLVIQNYETSSSETEMFAAGSYSERILNKPVLFAPGMKDKTNPFVVDITAQVVDLVD